jgi:hypothetical protein
LFPCVGCGHDRKDSTSSTLSYPDAFSCPSLTCSCVACTHCKLVLFVRAPLLTAPLGFWSNGFLDQTVNFLLILYCCLRYKAKDAGTKVSDLPFVPAPNYRSNISATTPAPTVRPPSLIANRNSFSNAIGVINSISIVTLSPGITISRPSGSFAVPVTSVVLK